MKPQSLDEGAKIDVAPDLGLRYEHHPGPRQALVDGLVFLLPQAHVPARKSVLDLAVGPSVLLEDDAQHAALGEHTGGLRARGGPPDDGDYILRLTR